MCLNIMKPTGIIPDVAPRIAAQISARMPPHGEPLIPSHVVFQKAPEPSTAHSLLPVITYT
jgi:hypothetical protein